MQTTVHAGALSLGVWANAAALMTWQDEIGGVKAEG
jgi:hypothetical protein